MTSELSAEVLGSAEAVANRAAQVIAALAREAIEARGKFLFAVSGAHTPWVMLRALAAAQIPWPGVRAFQVDERVAPAGHADRNLTHIKDSLLDHAIDRARQVVWVVTGAEKRQMLHRLLYGDPDIPAGRVGRERSHVLADIAADTGAQVRVEITSAETSS